MRAGATAVVHIVPRIGAEVLVATEMVARLVSEENFFLAGCWLASLRRVATEPSLES